MASKSVELALECKRQSENCLYTSTTLFIYLKFLRFIRLFFVVVPLILGSIATWNLLTSSTSNAAQITAAVCAFLAGLLPTIYAALKLDDHLAVCGGAAAEFKNLQDRFRQAALISAKKPFAEFEADFQKTMERMERARTDSITPPEPFFWLAQRKVKSGDYTWDVDIAAAEQAEASTVPVAAPDLPTR